MIPIPLMQVAITLTLLFFIWTPISALQIGDIAPSFSLKGSDNKIHNLSDYTGQIVVLAWFPRAFTGG